MVLAVRDGKGRKRKRRESMFDVARRSMHVRCLPGRGDVR